MTQPIDSDAVADEPADTHDEPEQSSQLDAVDVDGEDVTDQPPTRRPNLALRRARQSMRLSQSQFADAVRAGGAAMGVPNHCTKRLVQKWETGEHAVCRPDYLRVLQAVTGLSVRGLGFRLQSDESGARPAGAAGNAASDASGEGGVSGKVAAALSRAGLTEYSSDGTIEASMDRLRYAVNHPATVDLHIAGFVATATSRLFDLRHHSPSRLLAPTVERHMAMVTGLLTAARHAGVRQRLMMSAGQTAMLAGWIAFDRGDIASAHESWAAAISTAQGTADGALLAGTLMCQSYAAARRIDPGSAWQLAHTASEYAPDDPRATAWANARVALYAAQLGQREAASVAMKSALEVGLELPSPEPGDGYAPWTRFFDRARLLSAAAYTAALLKDQPCAFDYMVKAVDALGPAKVKARAVVLAECALTAAILGELQYCSDWGTTAATLAREMDVSVATDLLYETVPLVLPYSDTRAIRELLPQLTQLTRTPDLEDAVSED